VRRWIKKNLKPLAHDVDLGVETWLESTSYPEWRKEELRTALRECENPMAKRHARVKTHMKRETYPTPKHVRPINSRSDVFKTLIGPLMKAIETEVYKHPSFVKHIPVADRPNYIYNKLYRPGGKYAATDYTSFEALFTRELMESCEFELYMYMIKDVDDLDHLIAVLNVLLGENTCCYKWWTLVVHATRMSGEMCTSLGNGFSNLMFFLFIAKRKGCTDTDGAVEGDDGLFHYNGPDPTPADFAELGLVIKLVIHDEISTASFCGIVFDEVDLVNLRDPIQVLLNFGWGDARYARSRDSKLKTLLRCKALSFAHQYPGCPIIDAMARCYIRNTRSYDVSGFIKNDRYLGHWERERYLELKCFDERKIPFRAVGDRSRILMERLYNVTIEDQLNLERYFDSKNDCNPIDSSLLRSIVPNAYFDHFREYACEVSRTSTDVHFTGKVWSQYPGFECEFPVSYDKFSIPSR